VSLTAVFAAARDFAGPIADSVTSVASSAVKKLTKYKFLCKKRKNVSRFIRELRAPHFLMFLRV